MSNHDRSATSNRLAELGPRIAGEVVLPGDEGWDGARGSWNLAVDLRPVAVVYPATADDVVATIDAATGDGLKVSFCSGGHNTGVLDWSEPTILVKFERMQALAIDPAARRARIEPGVLSRALADAAGEHGLAWISGTCPDVGVAGYALGGGLSWLGREHGLGCNAIVGADVVLADGRLVHADRDSEPELFWALRGGSGNVGAVTALELGLVPLTEIYAGALLWPIERAAEILGAWRDWIDGVPDTCTSLGRMLQLPDAPFLPDHLRGRSFVLIEAAILGREADAIALVEPLRRLGPEFDTFETMPPNRLSEVNMDPAEPVPYAGDGTLLADFPPDAIARLVDTFVGSPLLHVEVRQLGGAIGRSAPDHGVLDAIDQPFVLFTFGLAPEPAVVPIVEDHAQRVLDAVGPWDSGRRYLNFAETKVDARSIFPEASFERLAQVRSTYDPTGLFRANHPVDRLS